MLVQRVVSRGMSEKVGVYSSVEPIYAQAKAHFYCPNFNAHIDLIRTQHTIARRYSLRDTVTHSQSHICH